MNIGLPGSRERDAQLVGDESSQDSNVARSGDVNDVGLKSRTSCRILG